MKFMIGCNYWASNAGVKMWTQWNEKAVENDLKNLSENGVEYLRVFPNWRDFQPVIILRGEKGKKVEYRMADERFPTNEYYIDEVLVERFKTFCKIAQKYNIKLIVGLLTGWMSGKLFVPAIFDNSNLYTDSTALLFEMRFVKGMVKYLKDQKAIFAWDLGNECNCMSEVDSEETASAWTAMISNTIRAFDNTRPIVSGMHSLGTENEWTIMGQTENTDILTTHPYPHFVPHCFKNRMTHIRTLLHPSCETSYYADIGNKECLTEEIGTLGPMTCNDETASQFLFTNLLSTWANGSLGLLFWCNSDYVELNCPPYTWDMMERELGLLDKNGIPRKTLLAIKRFSQILKNLDFDLPKPDKDAVCILTRKQDSWGAAYPSYILAKQNDINLKYAWCTQNIPEADTYMLPSISATNIMPAENYDILLERVKNGASLYISNKDGFLAKFKELTGLEVINSFEVNEQGYTQLYGEKIEFNRTKRYEFNVCGANVLSYDNFGVPAICENTYGKGKVFYVNFPLEDMLKNSSYGFDEFNHLIYKKFFEKKEKIASSDSQYVCVTQHKHDDKYIIVAINYSDNDIKDAVRLNQKYDIEKVLYNDISCIKPHDACIFEVKEN